MTEDAYHGTRGHSGGDASREAAEADLLSGVTNEVQRRVVELAYRSMTRGVTASEMRDHLGEHHGRVSSALTKMHIAGKLVALTERRGHGGIYVTPDNVDGREVRPYRRQNPRPDRDDLAFLLGYHERGWDEGCICGGADDATYLTHVADVILARLRGEEAS